MTDTIAKPRYAVTLIVGMEGEAFTFKQMNFVDGEHTRSVTSKTSAKGNFKHEPQVVSTVKSFIASRPDVPHQIIVTDSAQKAMTPASFEKIITATEETRA